MILSKVLAHFVESIDGPESQFRHFNPPIIHRLGVHNYDDEMKAVLFKTRSEAGTGSWRHARLYAIEALAQQFVGVCPAELAWFILKILPRAAVVLLNHNLTHKWVLHDYARQFADVCSRRFIVLVGEAMRIGIVCRLQTQCPSISVHLLEEVFHGLV